MGLSAASDAVTLLSQAKDPAVLAAVESLVLANKILTVEAVLDAYGHVSVRHPVRADRFLMSADCPPVLATAAQVSEYGLDGELALDGDVPSYYERYIHAAVYASRPDVHAICHNHTLDVLPFCAVPAARLDIISHTACVLEGPPPLWDISDEFGPSTNLMVTDLDRGYSMARTLAGGTAVLMRSHGSTVVGRDLRQLVVRTHELVRNARALIDALRLGGQLTRVSDAEIAMNAALTARGTYARQWQYYMWRVCQQGLE